MEGIIEQNKNDYRAAGGNYRTEQNQGLVE
jgi:hypothetical protein